MASSNSSAVSAGQDALASQFNNLRDDVLQSHHQFDNAEKIVDADIDDNALIKSRKLAGQRDISIYQAIEASGKLKFFIKPATASSIVKMFLLGLQASNGGVLKHLHAGHTHGRTWTNGTPINGTSTPGEAGTGTDVSVNSADVGSLTNGQNVIDTDKYPKTVEIWIDGVDRTSALGGSWGAGSAEFDTGELDISSYCTGTSHYIEIKETGGNGGVVQAMVFCDT